MITFEVSVVLNMYLFSLSLHWRYANYVMCTQCTVVR